MNNDQQIEIIMLFRRRLVKEDGFYSPVIAKNIPIGIRENVKYSESVVKIFPGDRFVIYTDGLVEVFNAQGELFGKNRLLTLLAESLDLTGEKISELLIKNVIAWSGKRTNESLDDDVTVIVVDVKKT